MKKILIVDDSIFSRQFHKKLVSKLGYEVLEAADGEAAIAIYQEEKPDLIITDLLMPGLDGMEMIGKLLKLDSSAKIVILSSDKQKFRKEEAKKLGVVEFLPKPTDEERLAAVLSSHTGEP